MIVLILLCLASLSAAQTYVDVLNISGVSNDGTTDCAPPLNKYLTGRSNTQLFFPAGTYLLGSSLTIPGNYITLQGQGKGVTVLLKGADAASIVINGNNNAMRELSVNGNGKQSANILVQGSTNHLTSIESYGGGGAGGQGVNFNGPNNAYFNVIESSEVHDNAGVGVSLSMVGDTRVVNCYIHDNQLEGITVDVKSYRCTIANNRLDLNCKAGGVGGIGTDDAGLNVFTGNIISNTGSNLPGLTFQNNIGGSSGCVISSNVFVDNPAGGVHLKTNNGDTDNIVVTNNVFQNCGKGVIVDAGSVGNLVNNNIFQ